MLIRRSSAARPLRLATLAAAAGLLFALQAVPQPASAQQRDPTRSIGETVASQPSAHYAFEHFEVRSADGQRTWRVHIAAPKGNAPEGGWPAFWMLDGNAALIEFDEALLAELAAQPVPHALVFVGYANDLRIDSEARTRDYTPFAGERPVREGGTITGGGGADALLEVIERQIRPEIERRVATNPAQQTLWGHSLAGLFALHVLYTRTGAFDTYAAGSPSLWWGDGAMLGAPEQRFVEHNAGRHARVLLGLGQGEREVTHRDLSDPRVQVHLRRIQAAPADSAEKLAQRLAQVDGLQVAYREFPALTHGPMFRASLMWALHAVTGIADHSDTPSRADGVDPNR
ncbi:alpha/beta hydrolase-fold protein [Luteimonas sp. 3794]|uniref:alpha/beta hydrolase n=1 Tax=Luteimonas sp. 3794 TaxID=2817730 RepID=UPI00285DC12A|nr:alpha/beta hydrolase-fold protein [Luteimonas sp. 3794]MDR6993056.1 putative alpha/beta superfamily hydrolase [Luteimonas sp. 3794]